MSKEEVTSTRLEVNLNVDTSEFIIKEHKEKGYSYNEIVRRAFAVYKLIQEAKEDHCEIILRSENGSIREVILT